MEISAPGLGREQKEPIPSRKSRQGVILCWSSSHPFCLSTFVTGEPWATKTIHLSLRIAWETGMPQRNRGYTCVHHERVYESPYN
ncbi:hypothetical protein Krac_6270 [Ktedonobacter racemifer DSM 44963]|uniref:Uncharacterized protein n=1 Tax=Ktedonobacter racemifer DSM 44963 TaxID=485913 RepID=D6TYN8_KTERA|nr:hypothetical protein Krac_6270 [Ktedonobacter racemifer DSM 44963]